jgi:acyl carrier protein
MKNLSFNRDDIKRAVLKHLRQNVDGLDDVEVDTSRSMLDVGATSLDIVEVVSSTMRELHLAVPRTELSKAKNMDGLIDLLYAAALKNAEK